MPNSSGWSSTRRAAVWMAPGTTWANTSGAWFERLRIVGVGGRNRHRHRDSRSIGQHVQLRAGLASVGRVRAGQIAPFFARTLAASTTALDQSIKPLATQLVEYPTMQPPPYPGFRPHREPPMRRQHAHPERRRQHPPITTAGQHEHHRRERRTLIAHGRKALIPPPVACSCHR